MKRTKKKNHSKTSLVYFKERNKNIEKEDLREKKIKRRNEEIMLFGSV